MIDCPIGDILKDKVGPKLFSVPVTAMVSEAVALMDEKSLGSILVRDASGAMAGIFTERDLMRRLVRLGRDAKTTPMSVVMTPEVRVVEASVSSLEVLRTMAEKGHRHTLVVADGRPAGVLSIRDLVRWLIRSSESLARDEGRGGNPGHAKDAQGAQRRV